MGVTNEPERATEVVLTVLVSEQPLRTDRAILACEAPSGGADRRT